MPALQRVREHESQDGGGSRLASETVSRADTEKIRMEVWMKEKEGQVHLSSRGVSRRQDDGRLACQRASQLGHLPPPCLSVRNSGRNCPPWLFSSGNCSRHPRLAFIAVRRFTFHKHEACFCYLVPPGIQERQDCGMIESKYIFKGTVQMMQNGAPSIQRSNDGLQSQSRAEGKRT